MQKDRQPFASLAGSAQLCQNDREAEWIRRISTGDTLALERLYKCYYPRLFRFVYRITHRVDFIEEVINDVMLVVWRKADTFNAAVRPSTWILGIAYNKSLKRLKEQQCTSHEVPIEDFEDTLPSETEDVIQQLENENWLAMALASLSPEQRAVVELVYHEGMHYSEIAKVMGCSENTVKTRMFHARKRLKSLGVTLKLIINVSARPETRPRYRVQGCLRGSTARATANPDRSDCTVRGHATSRSPARQHGASASLSVSCAVSPASCRPPPPRLSRSAVPALSPPRNASVDDSGGSTQALYPMPCAAGVGRADR